MVNTVGHTIEVISTLTKTLGKVVSVGACYLSIVLNTRHYPL